MTEAQQQLQSAQHIAVLTGAGISAASGIPTFRDERGLWRNFRPEELATPQAYARDPELVWEWYLWRLGVVLEAIPNSAHEALVTLEQQTKLTLVTQNVDGLHARAGSQHVLELHGNITHSRCESCGHLDRLSQAQKDIPRCSQCDERARPNVVWFGESLPRATFDAAIHAFQHCDVALIIGTSSVVEPAASLARLAQSEGACIIEVNPNRTPLTMHTDFSLRMDAVTGMQQLMKA